MAARGGETPMDFEYDNKRGNIDANSPFARYTHDGGLRSALAESKKRDYSVLSDPSSPFPTLRAPASSHTHLFNQPPSPSRPLSAIPSHLNGPAFTTPRKQQAAYDSSEAESSPDNNNADSEASPADNMGFRSNVKALVKAVSGNNDDKENDNLFLSRKPVSGKGEITPYSHKVEKRRQQRRAPERRFGGLMRRKTSSASDSESSQSPKKTKGKQDSQESVGSGITLAAFFKFIHEHPNLPHILSYYAQLALNIFFVSIIIYTIWSFWATIKADVDEKAAQVASGIMAEILACTEDFRRNRCDSRDRAPALETVCNNWKQCMDRDPMAVGRAKVSAHTFAEIFNSLIEPITWKAFAFTSSLFLGTVFASNYGFSAFRAKTSSPQEAPYGYQEGPPSTPHRGIGNGYYGHADGGYYSAYQSPYQSPTKSPSKGEMGMQTPRRQIKY